VAISLADATDKATATLHVILWAFFIDFVMAAVESIHREQTLSEMYYVFEFNVIFDL